jgi:hypothetical protein
VTTEERFTPEPWHADSTTFPRIGQAGEWWAIYAAGEEGELIAEIARTANGDDRDIERERANARLIAASPAMFNLLREAKMLMPLGTKKRADWVIKASELLARIKEQTNDGN